MNTVPVIVGGAAKDSKPSIIIGGAEKKVYDGYVIIGGAAKQFYVGADIIPSFYALSGPSGYPMTDGSVLHQDGSGQLEIINSTYSDDDDACWYYVFYKFKFDTAKSFDYGNPILSIHNATTTAGRLQSYESGDPELYVAVYFNAVDLTDLSIRRICYKEGNGAYLSAFNNFDLTAQDYAITSDTFIICLGARGYASPDGSWPTYFSINWPSGGMTLLGENITSFNI